MSRKRPREDAAEDDSSADEDADCEDSSSDRDGNSSFTQEDAEQDAEASTTTPVLISTV